MSNGTPLKHDGASVFDFEATDICVRENDLLFCQQRPGDELRVLLMLRIMRRIKNQHV